MSKEECELLINGALSKGIENIKDVPTLFKLRQTVVYYDLNYGKQELPENMKTTVK